MKTEKLFTDWPILLGISNKHLYQIYIKVVIKEKKPSNLALTLSYITPL